MSLPHLTTQHEIPVIQASSTLWVTDPCQSTRYKELEICRELSGDWGETNQFGRPRLGDSCVGPRQIRQQFRNFCTSNGSEKSKEAGSQSNIDISHATVYWTASSTILGMCRRWATWNCSCLRASFSIRGDGLKRCAPYSEGRPGKHQYRLAALARPCCPQSWPRLGYA